MSTATAYTVVAGVICVAVVASMAAVAVSVAPTSEDVACGQPTASGYPREIAWVAAGQKSRYVRCFKGKYFSEHHLNK